MTRVKKWLVIKITTSKQFMTVPQNLFQLKYIEQMSFFSFALFLFDSGYLKEDLKSKKAKF